MGPLCDLFLRDDPHLDRRDEGALSTGKSEATPTLKSARQLRRTKETGNLASLDDNLEFTQFVKIQFHDILMGYFLVKNFLSSLNDK